MRPNDFTRRVEFDNPFECMKFCYEYHLTSENSLLIEENDIHVLYYDPKEEL